VTAERVVSGCAPRSSRCRCNQFELQLGVTAHAAHGAAGAGRLTSGQGRRGAQWALGLPPVGATPSQLTQGQRMLGLWCQPCLLCLTCPGWGGRSLCWCPPAALLLPGREATYSTGRGRVLASVLVERGGSVGQAGDAHHSAHNTRLLHTTRPRTSPLGDPKIADSDGRAAGGDPVVGCRPAGRCTLGARPSMRWAADCWTCPCNASYSPAGAFPRPGAPAQPCRGSPAGAALPRRARVKDGTLGAGDPCPRAQLRAGGRARA
jgi:hypothetical protein